MEIKEHYENMFEVTSNQIKKLSEKIIDMLKVDVDYSFDSDETFFEVKWNMYEEGTRNKINSICLRYNRIENIMNELEDFTCINNFLKQLFQFLLFCNDGDQNASCLMTTSIETLKKKYMREEKRVNNKDNVKEDRHNVLFSDLELGSHYANGYYKTLYDITNRDNRGKFIRKDYEMKNFDVNGMFIDPDLHIVRLTLIKSMKNFNPICDEDCKEKKKEIKKEEKKELVVGKSYLVRSVERNDFIEVAILEESGNGKYKKIRFENFKGIPAWFDVEEFLLKYIYCDCLGSTPAFSTVVTSGSGIFTDSPCKSITSIY